MSHMKRRLSIGVLVLGAGLAARGYATHAQDRDDDSDHRVRKVFVIAMENHNWTQPTPTSTPQQLFKNVAAPFINSLVNGTSGISSQVSYATNYLNAAPGNHPSEPNYVWAEAGQPFNSVGTDADPYVKATCAVNTAVNSDQHLTAFLNRAGKTWRSYQEDVNVSTSNVPLAPGAWTVPLFSMSGLWTSPATNANNYTPQFNYAPKHNPMVFFRDTNGGCPAVLSRQYPPLQQLTLDLQSNDVADYNWITPDQYNEQHSSLSTGYGIYPSSDQASIAAGDNFLARIVPRIMASRAYQDGAAIILWWDESEGGDTAEYTLPFIVISKHVHPNTGGLPFASADELSHSSFLRSMQDIFDVNPDDGFPYLGEAAFVSGLSSLFAPGAVR
jgi:phosphatidylinositol-3-phosphatase